MQHLLVTGDPARLQQIVWNLVSNAIKFTPAGGRITAQLTRLDSHLELSVRDNGIGIASSFCRYVFERFRQADSSTTAARRPGARSRYRETPGGVAGWDGCSESGGARSGAIFKVRLPLASGDATFEPEMEVVPALDGNHGSREREFDLSGLRVLVVDDEQDTLEIVSLLLRRYGATVRTTLSSGDAFEVFNEWKPSVLISDLGMPGEDGYSLISKVRSLPPEAGGETPALALTAYVREEDQRRTIAAGYAMHLKKPVEPFSLPKQLRG